MIYSKEIDKICGLCIYASLDKDNKIYCNKKKKALEYTDEACKKFSYDIFKKRVRRKKQFLSDFKPEDFSL